MGGGTHVYSCRGCTQSARLARRSRRGTDSRAETCRVALGAVLAILAGVVLADLAWCNDGVALVGTLATIADRLTDETAALAGKRLGAAALEQVSRRTLIQCHTVSVFHYVQTEPDWRMRYLLPHLLQ